MDDTPFGGGEGMLLKADVLYSAWESVQTPPQTLDTSLDSPLDSSLVSRVAPNEKTATILLSPQGSLFTQEMARELATYSKLVFVCGHYEGVDERFIDLCVDFEVSIGNYVLTGGELPALVMADSITRLIPGVVGNERSVTEDSLENGLLKYPQYTRPREFMGQSVPPVLLGGDHKLIRLWREKEMITRTQRKRPDLWKEYLTTENTQKLESHQSEPKSSKSRGVHLKRNLGPIKKS